MSVLLSIPDQPIEKVEADVVVVGCLEDERPLRGAAARADWRLCGAISALLASSQLQGRAGEAALLASPGGVRAARVLALGLGPSSRRPAERLRAFAGDALARLERLQVSQPALALLPPECGEIRDQLEQLVAGLAAHLAEAGPGPQISMQLVASPDAVSEARRGLAQLATQHWPPGIAFDGV